MRLLNIDQKYTLYSYINEDCVRSYDMKRNMERIDEEFFKPWCKYLAEAELTADQIQQIFKTTHEKAKESGQNSTAIGKIVEKLIPDSMIKKLHSSLPEPDPNAQADPEFESKASAAVGQLPVAQDVKGGLMDMVKAAAKNPQMQSTILSLVGGTLGGLLSQVAPLIQGAFPGGGTIAVGITGAVVAGGVAVAAAKLQGKPWKEAFKGAIKPALAGAAGAVIGSIASQLASGAAGALMNKGGGSGGLDPNDPDVAELNKDSDQLNKALAADEQKMTSITGKYPPEEGFQYQSDGGDRIRVVDANGNAVFTSDIKPQTMDAKTFADLANAGKTVQQQTNVGTGNQISGDATRDFFGGDLDSARPILSDQAKGVIARDVAQQMGLDPNSKVVFKYDVPVSVDGQPVPQNIQQSYGGDAAGGPAGDPTGMGAASDFKPVDTGSLRQGGAPGGIAFPGDPGYKPTKTRMTQSREYVGQRLSEGQCYMLFSKIESTNDRLIAEGYLATKERFFMEAGLLSKAGNWLKTKAQNVTQTVTADKLNSAWKKAGSPTDSNAVATVLTQAGVNPETINQVFADMKLPAPSGAAGAQASSNVANVQKLINQLNNDDRQKVIAHLQKSLGTA